MVLLDIPMPKDCIQCPLRIQADCVLKQDADYETYEEQYKHCPLKEVQE